MQSMLQALAANDRKGVERLAVNEHEYRALILPGSVKPGKPPQIMPEEKSAYFWRMLYTNSFYTLDNIMQGHGGKKYNLKRIEVQRVEPFAWYIAHRDPILVLEEDDGTRLDVRLGSIAEYNGQFKFISFWSD